MTHETSQSIWQLLLTSGAVGGFVGGIIGAVIGPWATHRYTRKRERDAFVRSISDSYIEVAHEAERIKRIELGEFWRIGKLQDQKLFICSPSTNMRGIHVWAGVRLARAFGTSGRVT